MEVRDYIDSRPDLRQGEVLRVLHELCLSFPGVAAKLRADLPDKAMQAPERERQSAEKRRRGLLFRPRQRIIERTGFTRFRKTKAGRLHHPDRRPRHTAGGFERNHTGSPAFRRARAVQD